MNNHFSSSSSFILLVLGLKAGEPSSDSAADQDSGGSGVPPLPAHLFRGHPAARAGLPPPAAKTHEEAPDGVQDGELHGRAPFGGPRVDWQLRPPGGVVRPGPRRDAVQDLEVPHPRPEGAGLPPRLPADGHRLGRRERARVSRHGVQRPDEGPPARTGEATGAPPSVLVVFVVKESSPGLSVSLYATVALQRWQRQ